MDRLASFAAAGVAVDARAPLPAAAQLAARLRWAIESGAVADGQALPSIRAGAAELGLHPNTLRKAYAQLERDGYARTRHGLATVAVAHEGHGARLAEIAGTALAQARAAGISTTELAAAVLAGAAADAPASAAPRPPAASAHPSQLDGLPHGCTLGLVTADDAVAGRVEREARRRGLRLHTAAPGDRFALGDVAWASQLVLLGPDARDDATRRALAGARRVEPLAASGR
jgi:GntR family transcriptional regulator